MASAARSIRVTGSRFIAGYNQTEDGGAHNAAVAGSTPAPASNPRFGHVAIEGTRPDQFSLAA